MLFLSLSVCVFPIFPNLGVACISTWKGSEKRINAPLCSLSIPSSKIYIGFYIKELYFNCSIIDSKKSNFLLQILEEIAIVKKSKSGDKSYLVLKDQFFSEYNYFYYRFMSSTLAKAEVGF